MEYVYAVIVVLRDLFAVTPASGPGSAEKKTSLGIAGPLLLNVPADPYGNLPPFVVHVALPEDTLNVRITPDLYPRIFASAKRQATGAEPGGVQASIEVVPFRMVGQNGEIVGNISISVGPGLA
jgi:hypothetical protein